MWDTMFHQFIQEGNWGTEPGFQIQRICYFCAESSESAEIEAFQTPVLTQSK